MKIQMATYADYRDKKLDTLTDKELDDLIVQVANEEWDNETLQDAYLDELVDRARAREAS